MQIKSPGLRRTQSHGWPSKQGNKQIWKCAIDFLCMHRGYGCYLTNQKIDFIRELAHAKHECGKHSRHIVWSFLVGIAPIVTRRVRTTSRGRSQGLAPPPNLHTTFGIWHACGLLWTGRVDDKVRIKSLEDIGRGAAGMWSQAEQVASIWLQILQRRRLLIWWNSIQGQYFLELGRLCDRNTVGATCCIQAQDKTKTQTTALPVDYLSREKKILWQPSHRVQNCNII